MANHAVSFSTQRFFEFPEIDERVIRHSGTSSSNRKVIAIGDTVTFRYAFGVQTSTRVTISGFDSDLWTNTSPVSLGVGESVTKTIRSGASLRSDAVFFSASGFTGDAFYFTVVSGADTTPDGFSFNDLVQVSPNQTYTSNLIRISGINTPVAASINNGGSMSVNGGSYRTSATIVNGDSIRIRRTSGGYGARVSTTITVGGVSDTWYITTKASPDQGQIIPFPITSLPINFNAIKQFFGGNGSLNDYRRGGTYVPDISQNSRIPTGVPLDMHDFLGSATSFYFTKNPTSRFAFENTFYSGRNIQLIWNFGIDWAFGYANIGSSVEHRYTLVQTTGSGLTLSPSSAGSFSTSNNYVSVSRNFNQKEAGTFIGYIRIEARHKDYPSRVLTQNVSYNIEAYSEP
ncbi:hypothetical protein J7384_17020 [Endozoicomonas sp. G2_1]|uniref:hypothetical protein n=1 Tax=Endozoicomonas sp. G2_1 TaxID=2821091 RepID=UPI001ADD0CF5|nr:hypothetical protein [Endozoicomonas sp. G2_1]MBO9492066.1 hypothetical protein [Endozoicomonas sp. G2_1]